MSTLTARTNRPLTFRDRLGARTIPAGVTVEVDEHEMESNPKLFTVALASHTGNARPYAAVSLADIRPA